MNVGDRIGVMRGGMPYIGEFGSPAGVDVVICEDTFFATWILPFDKVKPVYKWRPKFKEVVK